MLSNRSSKERIELNVDEALFGAVWAETIGVAKTATKTSDAAQSEVLQLDQVRPDTTALLAPRFGVDALLV